MTNGEKLQEIFPYLTKQMLSEKVNIFEWWNAEYKESIIKGSYHPIISGNTQNPPKVKSAESEEM